ncbi:MAG TPA: dTMP kinase, partial [Polyangiales bacterium]
MRQGLFIVIEGVDGAGTTTQVSQLSAALRDKLAVRETREPTVGPVGALLRLAINGRLVTPGPLGVHAPGWKTLALMFAADRLDHIESEIAPLLAEGVCVISDRYYHSSVAYQSRNADAGPDAIGWIRTINQHARTPDLTIVLDVSAATAGKRRRQRGGVELFDDDALQLELIEFYRSLERHFPGELITHVDGEASVE